MLDEFREFINRGNVIDLAVAVVMGAAFAPVISAIVESILMPLIGLVFSEPNFDAIGRFGCDGGECSGSVGVAITALVNFFFVALALFFVVKGYNRMSRKSPEQDAGPEPDADPDDIVLLREIRDALRERQDAP